MIEFKHYCPWFVRDWLTSDARARLTLPQRAIYLELIGLAHLENGIASDAQVLAGKLGLSAEHAADLQAALQEFEVHPEDDDKLMHPRTWAMIEEQRQRISAANTRWSKTKAKSAPQPALANKTEDEDSPF